MAAQAIMLAMVGVPGIYFHSLFGSRGWPAGVQQTGRSRTINRQKLQRSELESRLSDPDTRTWLVYNRYKRLLRARSGSPAFHPFGGQRVLRLSPAVFAIERTSPDEADRVSCVHNVTDQGQQVSLDADLFGIQGRADWRLRDLIGDKIVHSGDCTDIEIAPYQTLWLVDDLVN
jgi:sucrose phosphorylase